MLNIDFFRSLFATFAGVFLAFMLDRLVFRSESIQKKKNDKSKLKIALISIARSLEYDKGHLISLDNTFAADTYKVVLPLDTYTWDAYKADVFLLLKDLSLRNDLIHYFLTSATLKYVSDLNFKIIPNMPSNKEGKENWQMSCDALRKNVEDFNGELIMLREQLILKLKRAISEL